MFAMLAGDWFVRQNWWPGRMRLAAPLAAMALLVAWNVYQTPRKRHFGYSEVAGTLLSRRDFKNSSVMICSTSEGEGMLISEIAMREARPGHIILRGFKMLASSDWMGWNYQPRFQNAHDMLAWMDTVPTGFVVIDDTGRRTPHGKMLYDGIQAHPETWERLPIGVGDILVFRLLGEENRPVKQFEIPMQSSSFGAFVY